MIGIDFVHIIKGGPLTVIGSNAITSEIRWFNGVLSWLQCVHADGRDELFHDNISIGQHSKEFVDVVSFLLGPQITDHVFRRMTLTLEAAGLGVHRLEYRKARSPEDFGSHQIFDSIDDLGGWSLTALRDAYPKSTVFDSACNLGDGKDITLEKIMNSEFPLVSEGVPGVFIDWQPVRTLYIMFFLKIQISDLLASPKASGKLLVI